ncbi:hypothetical protein LUZ60_000733 [Juncus effusus]|nr:hypothetical protein LUZ60_000733 [Juncus effusus]
MTIVEMSVHIDCVSCESKIRKALEKLTGVDSVEIDMPSQKVTVTGSLDQKKILKVVRRTGRRAVLWPSYPYNGQLQTQQYGQQFHPALAQTNFFNANPASSYNYYKHGYDDLRVHYGYGQQLAGHSVVTGDSRGDMFSDDNPHACSVM